MEPPHPYWAHHDHSDEHLNLLFTPYPQETEPPHPSWTDHDHDRSDEHLNVVYPTVRELRSFYPPSPDDSGYFSPSETQWRARRWKLRVVNTTPPPASPSPPSPPPAATTSLLVAEDEDVDDESQNFLSRDLSSGWSASSSADSASTIIRVKTEEKNDKKKTKRPGEHSPAKHGNSNICSRALRRAARKCIAKNVLAAKRKMMKKISRSAAGSSGADSETHFGLDIGNSGLDGVKDEKKDPNGSGSKKEGVGEISMWKLRVGVLERIKRTLLRKKGPVELKRAQVRFPLD